MLWLIFFLDLIKEIMSVPLIPQCLIISSKTFLLLNDDSLITISTDPKMWHIDYLTSICPYWFQDWEPTKDSQNYQFIYWGKIMLIRNRTRPSCLLLAWMVAQIIFKPPLNADSAFVKLDLEIFNYHSFLSALSES